MSAAAPIVAFGLGAVSAVSPCAATRLSVLVAMLQSTEDGKRISLCAAFVVGIVASCALIVACVTLWIRWIAVSPWLYAGLAIALSAYGLRTLLTPEIGRHGCSGNAGSSASHGWAFLNGAALGLVGSPCCTPVLVDLAALRSQAASDAAAWMLGIAFLGGHVVAIVPVTAIAERLTRQARTTWSVAYATVAAGVLIALGGYYALLA